MNDDKKNSPLFFSGGIYSAEALRLAAAVFSARGGVRLKSGKDGTEAAFSGGITPGEFANEALNQQCRIDLSARNSRLSGIIVTKALLSASGSSKKGGK
jgi:hypothetical protein